MGKLTKVVAIGGETTGWALDLESDLKIDRTKVKRIDVDPGRENVEKFKDKDQSSRRPTRSEESYYGSER